MKYLNHFESFAMIMKKDQLIRRLRSEEYTELFDENISEITGQEFQIISKMIHEFLPLEKDIKLQKRLKSDKIKSCIKVTSLELESLHTLWFIFFKFDDDWWLIEELTDKMISPFTYWAVDSHDGLREWLKKFI